MPPRIRAAAVSDLPELLRLDRDTFGRHAYSAATTRQLLELFGGLVLLAEDGDGVARAYAFGALAAGNPTGWILALGVQADHRRLGFGRDLCRELLARLGGRGARLVRLTCAPDHHGALGFYREEGFDVVDEVADYLGPGRDRLVLELAV